MKKLIFSASSVFLACLGVYAQTDGLKFNLFSPLVRTFNISYEKKVDKYHTVQLGLFLTGYHSGGTNLSGIGVTPEYRIYLGETEAPDGFFVAPFLRYMNFGLTDDSNNKGKFNAFGGGLCIGRQWVFRKNVTFEMFVGPAYYAGTVSGSNPDNFDVAGAFNGFSLRGGVNLGIRF